MRPLHGAAVSSLGALVVGLAAFAWPLFLSPRAGVSPAQAPVVFALVLALVLAVALSQLGGGRLDARALAMLGVLTAVGMVLRPLSAGTAGVELVFFLLVVGGRVFGTGFGFSLGALTMAGSALLTAGVGPWLPYQMLAAALVGLGAGALPRASGRAELALLAAYGVVSAFAFGWLMDLAFWPFVLGGGTQVSFDPQAGPAANLHRFVLYNLATSMGWNVGRAVTTAVLLLVVGTPLLRLLRRTTRAARFAEPAGRVAGPVDGRPVSRPTPGARRAP